MLTSTRFMFCSLVSDVSGLLRRSVLFSVVFPKPVQVYKGRQTSKFGLVSRSLCLDNNTWTIYTADKSS